MTWNGMEWDISSCAGVLYVYRFILDGIASPGSVRICLLMKDRAPAPPHFHPGVEQLPQKRGLLLLLRKRVQHRWDRPLMEEASFALPRELWRMVWERFSFVEMALVGYHMLPPSAGLEAQSTCLLDHTRRIHALWPRIGNEKIRAYPKRRETTEGGAW